MVAKYHNHPLLKANLSDYDFLTEAEPPKDFEISVLLPLSGDLANAGRAIRDGILYEYQKHRPDLGIALTIIDSESSTADVLAQIDLQSLSSSSDLCKRKKSQHFYRQDREFRY